MTAHAKQPKKEARVIGFDDAPFRKGIDKTVLVVGTIFRGGHYMDGVISTKVRVDGSDATTKLSSAINTSKFKPQLQAIFLNGIAVGGFNVINIHQLSKKTRMPVITIIRDHPDYTKIHAALIKTGMKKKIQLLTKAGMPISIDHVYFQHAGCTDSQAAAWVRLTTTHSHIPEPLRAAHLIARGVTMGESKGKA